jgi:glycosyltransferase involved in cell wall biosynthesis
MTSAPTRAVLVMDHPAQHFTRALQLLGQQPDVELKVCYWSTQRHAFDQDFNRPVSWDVDLLGGYDWVDPGPGGTGAGRVARFLQQMRTTRPDVVLCYGWASTIARVAILYCVLTRTRLLLYGDSTWQHSSRGARPLLRSAALRILMRLCDGAVSTGTFNREFYIRHGMSPRSVSAGVCPADIELYGPAYDESRAGFARDSGALRIGFAGKLIARKGPDELLRAVALLPRGRPWSVTLIGEGPLMPELRTLATQLELGDRVSFHGFANTTEMPKLLAGLDVVVVPSRLDMRALVTIEAMAAGAVVVVSDATAVWGPGDLIEEGVSGLVYRSGDPIDLARQLGRVLADRGLLAGLRGEGMKRSARFGPAAFAQTTARALAASAGRGRGKPGV